MLARLIPKTGEPLPAIGIGSYGTFDADSSATAASVLEEFAQAGGALVDSSPMYGRAETVIGDALRHLDAAKKFFVATKVWTNGRHAGIDQMQDSQRKLQVSRIDLMQIHNLLDVDTHLDTLEEWKWEGRIRYIGITHYTASAYSAVEKALGSRSLDFLQVNYSLAEREAEKKLLPLAADRGIAVIVNRPFAGGQLLKRLHKRALPEWAVELECDSWAQLALKFIISNPAVTCAIPATANIAHLRDYMRAGTGALPDRGLREKIAAAAA